MSDIVIEILKSEVYDEVAHTAAYIGAKDALDGSSYEQIELVPTQYGKLDRYWDEACALLSDSMLSYREQAIPGGDSYIIELLMPNNWRECTVGLTKEAVSFIVDYIVSKWLHIVKRDAEARYIELYTEHAAAIKELLSRRKRPLPPMYEFDDAEAVDLKILINGKDLVDYTDISPESYVFTVREDTTEEAESTAYLVYFYIIHDEAGTSVKSRFGYTLVPGRTGKASAEYRSDADQLACYAFATLADAVKFRDNGYGSVEPVAYVQTIHLITTI